MYQSSSGPQTVAAVYHHSSRLTKTFAEDAPETHGREQSAAEADVIEMQGYKLELAVSAVSYESSEGDSPCPPPRAQTLDFPHSAKGVSRCMSSDVPDAPFPKASIHGASSAATEGPIVVPRATSVAI